MPLIAHAECDSRDPLDNYIEAHVHGPVMLGCDVEALVLDPSFKGTTVEELARLLPCPIEWHLGFLLTTEELNRRKEYRGDDVAHLGLTISRHGLLTPALVGDALVTGKYDYQAIKHVWHCVARFGDRSQISTAPRA